VHIQREREAVLFGGDFMRLKEVVYSFTPGQGPLALDDGPTAMPIEPKGYNRTQELISAMTYSKAPSVPLAPLHFWSLSEMVGL
jgi:aminopeptidase N